jgi:tRNA/tmRNA/rRNA uracil-C5-methylase (TrmA/RlmC/RlmD family)
MGNHLIKNKISNEDMQHVIKHKDKFILINTMPDNLQQCLIRGTLSIDDEIKTLNNMISKNIRNIPIVVYGVNNNDSSVITKYQKLTNQSFQVFIYIGGMFEWLLLQDIYGVDEYPTTSKELDLLKYQPKNIL